MSTISFAVMCCRVYIVSKKLIAKDQLFHIGKTDSETDLSDIGKYAGADLFEKFQLSESVHAGEVVGPLYEDSVLMELEAYSPYKRSIMKNAKRGVSG